MGQTGSQGVKQDDVNCGNQNPVQKVHVNLFTGPMVVKGRNKKNQNNSKLHLTQNWFETCYPD